MLLHDSLGCIALWRSFPEMLARACGRAVIAYDRAGFGESVPRDDRLSATFIRDEAAIMLSLLDALNLEKVVLFGHSVGGGMAVTAAPLLGDRCVAVISESAQAMVEEQTLSGIRDARDSFNSPQQLNRLMKYHGDKAEWVLRAWVETWLSPEFTDWNLDADVRKMECPLLCIHGDKDEFGSLAHPHRIKEQSGGPVSLVVLESCGHVPHREQPEKVLAELVRFLEALP
ncbi:MAG: alpha/beta fold hydrolase [Alcanivorax sediminis]|uniref:alpha/beta fold hydrolase n=1 Tax=Alcanivorax sediminis TaxID=2663008 RepID=UPI003C3A1FED